jgi:hypothetical protein
MNEDSRCCGSGTCIIDTEGGCWCGQRWDGDMMSPPALDGTATEATAPEPGDQDR